MTHWLTKVITVNLIDNGGHRYNGEFDCTILIDNGGHRYNGEIIHIFLTS